MTDANADSRDCDIDAQRASDGTGDTEDDRVSEANPTADGQHASADVAPELFGW